MKIAVIVIRVLMRLLFLFSSIVVLFRLVPQLELKGGAKLFMEGMEASICLMPLLMITELWRVHRRSRPARPGGGS